MGIKSAVKGFRVLEQAGLGKVIENTPQRGATIVSPHNIVIMCNTLPIPLIDINLRKAQYQRGRVRKSSFARS